MLVVRVVVVVWLVWFDLEIGVWVVWFVWGFGLLRWGGMVVFILLGLGWLGLGLAWFGVGFWGWVLVLGWGTWVFIC